MTGMMGYCTDILIDPLLERQGQLPQEGRVSAYTACIQTLISRIIRASIWTKCEVECVYSTTSASKLRVDQQYISFVSASLPVTHDIAGGNLTCLALHSPLPKRYYVS
jgi:hypothetical protein